jgi:hypothetical protein
MVERIPQGEEILEAFQKLERFLGKKSGAILGRAQLDDPVRDRRDDRHSGDRRRWHGPCLSGTVRGTERGRSVNSAVEAKRPASPRKRTASGERGTSRSAFIVNDCVFNQRCTFF